MSILKNLFQKKESSCCNIKIEEVKNDKKQCCNIKITEEKNDK